MDSTNRSLEDIYQDYRLYDKKIEQQRVEHRKELIRKLRAEEREENFVKVLEESENNTVQPLDFEKFCDWWSNLSNEQQEYFEGQLSSQLNLL